MSLTTLLFLVVMGLGISERIENAAEEKEHERREKSFKELFTYFETCKSVSVNDLIGEIKDIVESGFYERLIITISHNKKSDDDIRCMGKLLQNRIIYTAFYYSGLKENFKNIFSNRFNINCMLDIYRFVESIYILNINREMNFKDTLNVYLSGLDERILFAQDSFDEVNIEEIPEVDLDIFQLLLDVKWKDGDTEILYNKLKDLLYESAGLILEDVDDNVSLSDYTFIEQNFIELLIASSTVSARRALINPEDVVKAYETFFKLIKTDLTTYGALPERLNSINGGFLVCKKCGYFYQLQPGESADDYIEQCECGGKLTFCKQSTVNVENNLPEDISFSIMVTLFLMAWLIVYYMLQAFHWQWADMTTRLILFAFAVSLFLLFYLAFKSLFSFFDWNMGINLQQDKDRDFLICKKCNTKYPLNSGELVEDFPEKCVCGGKLICKEEEEKGIDVRNSRRIINIGMFGVSYILLSTVLMLFNINLFVLYNGEWKYMLIVFTLLCSVYLTVLVLRLLNRLGLKIKYY